MASGPAPAFAFLHNAEHIALVYIDRDEAPHHVEAQSQLTVLGHAVVDRIVP
jgi:hypothetical protein